MVKTLDSNYAKELLEQISANTTNLNYKEKTQLIGLLKDFEDLFYENIGDWDTDTVDLELKPD